MQKRTRYNLANTNRRSLRTGGKIDYPPLRAIPYLPPAVDVSLDKVVGVDANMRPYEIAQFIAYVENPYKIGYDSIDKMNYYTKIYQRQRNGGLKRTPRHT